MRLIGFLLIVFSLAWPSVAQQKTDYSIATIERKPFAFQTDEGWEGFSIDLWNAVADEIAVQSDFKPVEKFSDLLSAVEWEEADVGVANISITYAREQRMDFTQPIFDAGLIILMPTASDASVFSAIFNPALFLWLGGAGFLLFLAANMIWLLERRDVDEFRTPYGRGLLNGLWWAVNVVTNAGFDIVSPAHQSRAFARIGLIIVGIFVMGAFVAQITASLTVGQIVNQVGGYEDLYNRRVGTTTGSTSASFLTGKSVQYEGYDSLEVLFDALETGEIEAIVHDAPILAYYAQTEGLGRFETVGRIFNPEKYGFAVPSGFARTEEINRALLKLRESGTYDALIEKWFGVDYQ